MQWFCNPHRFGLHQACIRSAKYWKSVHEVCRTGIICYRKCAKSVQKVCMRVVDPQKKSAKSLHKVCISWKKVCKKSAKSLPDADFADSCRLLKKSARVCPPMNMLYFVPQTYPKRWILVSWECNENLIGYMIFLFRHNKCNFSSYPTFYPLFLNERGEFRQNWSRKQHTWF